MSRPKLVRLDRVLVERGLASSRQRARELIEAGRVTIDGLVVRKASTQFRPDRALLLTSDAHSWVGRGATKLLGALDALPMEVEGHLCADLGASTGGFTEVLLRRGAKRVYAIDVGRGQLHRRLATDARVVVMDSTNVRHLTGLPDLVDRVVGDLSFISLTKILPAVRRLLPPDGEALLLIKPQFEAGRGGVNSRGKVKDESIRVDAIERVRADAAAQGFEILGGEDCTLPGAKSGNVEYFVWLRALAIR